MMRNLTLQLLLTVVVLVLGFTTSRAEALRRVEVSGPAINCLFDPTCRVQVTDSTETLSIGTKGPSFLQSRTFRGRPGSPAAGLYVYEYRIDLRRATGILHVPCLDSLSLDFGPIVRTLDLDGDGDRGDEVFVLTRGGLGSIGLASAEKSGSTITFRFSNSVCAGGRPGEGQSTFFFGLVSNRAPRQTTATILESTGRLSKVYARTPRQKNPLQQEIPHGAPVKKSILLAHNAGTPEAAVAGPIPVQNRGRAREEYEAVVDRITPQPCVERGSEVNVFGSGFGRRQGGRVVELGGHGINALLRVTAWSDRRITAIVPNYRRIEQGQWYFIGLQNEDRHWISNISRTITICRRLE